MVRSVKKEKFLTHKRMQSALSLFGWLCAGLSQGALGTTPWPDYRIEITGIQGNGCPHPEEIKVELSPTGKYFIKGRFNQNGDTFAAETVQTPTARTVCTISYNLRLAPGKILDYAEFGVDGEYHLSQNGTAFMSIRHHVPGTGEPTIHSAERSRAHQDPPHGNFGLAGSIEGIDRRVNRCGGVIPLEIQLRATARRQLQDPDTTFISIDNGESRGATREVVRTIFVWTHVSNC